MGNINPITPFPYNDQIGYPYSYVAKFPTLGSGSSLTIPVEIDALYVFKWQTLTFDKYTPTGAQAIIDEMLVQITDTRSSRNFFDQPIPLSLICGNGSSTGGEFVLPVPHLFDPSSIILVNVTNATTGVVNDLDIVFSGLKIPVNTQGAMTQG